MTESSISLTRDLLNADRSNTESESEARILTQIEVDEQIKTNIATLTKHLEDLTRLMQGMSSVHRQNNSLRAITTVNSSVADTSPDTDRIV